MCEHGARLRRQRRTFIMKLLLVKEYYQCSNCGYQLIIGSEYRPLKWLTSILFTQQDLNPSKSDLTHT